MYNIVLSRPQAVYKLCDMYDDSCNDFHQIRMFLKREIVTVSQDILIGNIEQCFSYDQQNEHWTRAKAVDVLGKVLGRRNKVEEAEIRGNTITDSEVQDLSNTPLFHSRGYLYREAAIPPSSPLSYLFFSKIISATCFCRSPSNRSLVHSFRRRYLDFHPSYNHAIGRNCLRFTRKRRAALLRSSPPSSDPYPSSTFQPRPRQRQHSRLPMRHRLVFTHHPQRHHGIMEEHQLVLLCSCSFLADLRGEGYCIPLCDQAQGRRSRSNKLRRGRTCQDLQICAVV